ncbi:MAG: hypothetical protein LBR56_08470 [Sporomusaceae bacterium]|nr:hypothetical protein [Sporomusaceae bacterium]
MSSNAVSASFRLAVGLVSPEEAGSLLSLISKEEKVVILTNLLQLSESNFPVVSRSALKGYPSLELFWNPYKRIGDVLMALEAYNTSEEVLQIIDALSKKIPNFGDEVRPHILYFEEIMYLTDLELQAVLRREGLNAFVLLDTSSQLKERILRNVSSRVKKDAELRLAELNSLPPVEMIANNSTALRHKAHFVKTVIDMRQAGEIEGPYVPLTASERSLIPQKMAELISQVSALEEDSFSFWLNDMVDWKDLAPLYYYAPPDFVHKMNIFLTRPMREAINKNAPKPNQISMERKEAEALARLKKTLS